jgi:hypothetical protein
MVTDPLFGGKGTPLDPGVLRAGNFYVAIEGEAFRRIVAPSCLSYHPASPPSAEDVLALAQRSA